MATEKPIKHNNLSRYLKPPIETLRKVKDFCINGIAELSGQIGHGAVMPRTMGHVMPKSFSVNSTMSGNYDDYHRELARAGSKRSLKGPAQKSKRSPTTGVSRKMPRSHSVGMARIEEGEACDFGPDVVVNIDAFPRSRSCAVPRNTDRAF